MPGGRIGTDKADQTGRVKRRRAAWPVDCFDAYEATQRALCSNPDGCQAASRLLTMERTAGAGYDPRGLAQKEGTRPGSFSGRRAPRLTQPSHIPKKGKSACSSGRSCLAALFARPGRSFPFFPFLHPDPGRQAANRASARPPGRGWNY